MEQRSLGASVRGFEDHMNSWKRDMNRLSQEVSQDIYYIPAPSNRSPLEAFADLKVAGGDLLEGAGIHTIHIYIYMVFDPLCIVRSFSASTSLGSGRPPLSHRCHPSAGPRSPAHPCTLRPRQTEDFELRFNPTCHRRQRRDEPLGGTTVYR